MSEEIPAWWKEGTVVRLVDSSLCNLQTTFGKAKPIGILGNPHRQHDREHLWREFITLDDSPRAEISDQWPNGWFWVTPESVNPVEATDV